MVLGRIHNFVTRMAQEETLTSFTFILLILHIYGTHTVIDVTLLSRA